MFSTPISTPDDSDHEIQLMTQSYFGEVEAIKPTLMEHETNPRKIKLPSIRRYTLTT